MARQKHRKVGTVPSRGGPGPVWAGISDPGAEVVTAGNTLQEEETRPLSLGALRGLLLPQEQGGKQRASQVSAADPELKAENRAPGGAGSLTLDAGAVLCSFRLLGWFVF